MKTVLKTSQLSINVNGRTSVASCINLAPVLRLCLNKQWPRGTFPIQIRPIYLFITEFKVLNSLEEKKLYD